MKELKLILNGNDFSITGFSRSTMIQDGKLVSNAYVGLKDPAAADVESLRALAAYTITALTITADNEPVYELEQLTAKITSIEESIGDEGMMRVYFNIAF